MLELLILYGSQNGTAQDYAETIYLEATMSSYKASLKSLNEVLPWDRLQIESSCIPIKEKNIVIVISNTGDGDAPDNATIFWEWLRERAGENSFEGYRIGVLGLGDSNYATFNNTGKILAEILPKLGATWIIPPGFCDAEEGTDKVADPWMGDLWKVLKSLQGATMEDKVGISTLESVEKMETITKDISSLSVNPYKPWIFNLPPLETPIDEAALPRLHPDTITIKFLGVRESTKDTAPSLSLFSSRNEGPSHRNPLSASIKSIDTITSPGAVKAVKHFLLEAPCQDVSWSWEAGDSFGIVCENDPEAVGSVLDALEFDPNQHVMIMSSSEPSQDTLLDFISGKQLSVREIFLKYVDIMHFPKKTLLRAFAEHCSSSIDQNALFFLCSKAGSSEYMKLASGHANLIDFLHSFPSCKPPLATVLSRVPLLHPRYYSICNTHCNNQDHLEFIYSATEYSTPEPGCIKRLGVCSRYLERIEEEWKIEPSIARLEIFPRPAPHFRLIDDPSIPLIFICAGTGISPFVGFLRTVKAKGLKPDMTWLIFGIRDRSKDFLFENVLSDLQKEPAALTRLSLAISRESDAKGAGHNYVQDVLRENNKEVYELVTRCSGRIFICGDELTMVKEVNTTIQEMIASNAGIPPKEALAVFNQWNNDKRIIRDIWV